MPGRVHAIKSEVGGTYATVSDVAAFLEQPDRLMKHTLYRINAVFLLLVYSEVPWSIACVFLWHNSIQLSFRCARPTPLKLTGTKTPLSFSSGNSLPHALLRSHEVVIRTTSPATAATRAQVPERTAQRSSRRIKPVRDLSASPPTAYIDYTRC